MLTDHNKTTMPHHFVKYPSCNDFAYLDFTSDKFPNPVVKVLLYWEAQKFASYLTTRDIWLLRQVSRLFHKWALSADNALLILWRYAWDVGLRSFSLATIFHKSWMEKLMTGKSWLSILHYAYNVLEKYSHLVPPRSLTPVGPPSKVSGHVEWYFAYNQEIEKCNKRLLFLRHRAGFDRYDSEMQQPKHNLKLCTLMTRNPESRLPCAESVFALFESLLGSEWSTQAVLTRETVSVSQFDAVRDCLPYASEPDVHLLSWIVRACLYHPQVRNEILGGYNTEGAPFETILRIKMSLERLMELVCDAMEKRSSGLIEYDWEAEAVQEDTLLDLTQPLIRGILALPPQDFWRNLFSQDPLPELTEELESYYTELAELYKPKQKRAKGLDQKLPWFGVSGSVVKGATIAHQLYQLDLMSQVALESEVLIPFKETPTTPCEHFVKVQVNALDGPADHPGDVCTLYVGPRGAVMFTCNHAMLTSSTVDAGWSRWLDFLSNEL
eukprot:Blabericola_migrator_1__5202@NODE_267_length_10594_cov_56_602451_g223_i0_p4_GENE_NODE_267_length_10594_cov_56_602451_g223_i0NODE_267_length_10594_cov_56_602451_g223_i0_p4_ORF_typecomplete_len496_score61_40Fboxlike/PF12937_7/0_38Fboxlike/PF12937_7/4_7e03Fboxlike/PF12937_7/7_6e03_NODE_267_length_10594_cov_56_602451_g223_i046066093